MQVPNKALAPKSYKFRAEMLDDVVSFIAQAEPSLINPIGFYLRIEQKTLDCLVRFKTTKTLDELHAILDTLEDCDMIKESLETIVNAIYGKLGLTEE